MHIMRIAWSSGEKDVIAEGIQNATNRRGNGLSLDENTILLPAGGLLSTQTFGGALLIVPRHPQNEVDRDS